MHRLPPILLILLAPLLLAQELPVTPSALLPAAFTHGAAVATAGDRTLVVWSDFRNRGDVYAARIDAAGNVLDPAGILLFHGQAGFAAAPAPDGGFFVAVTPAVQYGQTAVFRVTRDGAVSPPKTIDDTAPLATAGVQIATNGETFLVLVSGQRAFLTGLDGTVLTGPIVLGRFYQRAAVASDGRDYLVAASDGKDLMATPISSAGVAGTPRVLIPNANASAVAMASDGTRYFVAAASPPGSILTAMAAGDGSLTGTVGLMPMTNISGVRAVWDGSRFVLMWTVTPLSVTDVESPLFGSPVDSEARITNVRPLGRSLTFDGGFDLGAVAGNVLLVHGNDFRLFGTLLNAADLAAGALPPDFAVARTAAPETTPLLTATNAGAVVLWNDLAARAWRAETLDTAGRPTGRIIDVAEKGADSLHAAFDGADVVISWRTFGTIFARRYTTSLDAVDAAPVRIAGEGINGIQTHALAAGGGAALFAWTSYEQSAPHGALLTRAGGLVPVALPQVPRAAAAWNGSEFLVAYAFATGPPPTQGLFPDPPADIRTIRVAPNGALLDATPRTIAHLTTYVDELAAASNGSGFLVAWRPDLYQRFGIPSVIAGKFVAADGTTDDAAPRTLSGTGVSEGPFLTAYGNEYAIAWTTRPTFETRVVQWRTTSSEAIESLPPMPIAYYAGGGAIAAIGPRLELAYSRIDESAGSVERVFVRAVSAPVRRHVARR